MTSATFGAQLLYYLLGALCLIDYLRWRDRPRLFVALTFGSFAAFFVVRDLLALYPSLALQALDNLLLLAHPFLLISLIHFIVPISARLRRSAGWGFAVIALLNLAAVFVPPNLINLAGLLTLAYFIVFEAYAALATVRGVRQTVGVPRRRLMMAAAGTGALAFLVLYLLLSALLKVLQPSVPTVLAVCLNLSALCHYLGFATPRWLRQTWQLSEFHRFLKTVGGQPAAQRADRALEELCRAGAYVTGGLAAAVALADPDNGGFKVQTLPVWSQLAGPLTLAPESALGRAWETQHPEQSAGAAQFGLPAERLAGLAKADVLLAVPIASVERRWGVLFVLRRGQSPFVPDDFSLLTLLTEQTALALDYAALIGELRRHSVQLEASNKELEAFSYSVSHDLRAPLRAVDGFSQVLLEDYGPQLPPDALDHLNRIRKAVTRMASLIDDLLQLARVARAEMRVETVDLSRLAGTIVDELRQAQPERQLTLLLHPGLTATGDERLLRLVLENLLGNAWKFTSQRPTATIEFGQQAGGEAVFFVRDNGAGFDMAHAGQLFGAFQRLHSNDQFPGTGVGLATVQRIVQRHGGRIWAQAAVNEGATFFFTLGLAPVRAPAN